MKTLFIAPALFSSEGGIERMMRLYLKALCETGRDGDRVSLAALNDAQFPADRMAPYINERLVWQRPGNRRHLPFTLRCLLHSLTCDRIVAGHFHLMRIVHWARRLRPTLQAFIVAHGTEIWRPWTREEQRMAQGGIHFLAVSHYTRRQILGHCPGLLDRNVMVLPNALDPALATDPAQPVTRDPALILTVTRLSASDTYKGVDHLIQAMPLIRREHPEARLRIVGKGNDRPRLEALAARHAPGAVEFAGYVPDAAMPGEYARAALFALPSRDEGFGLVYLEAFRQGTPCVAASAGAAPELITPESGRCAVYGDVADIASCCVEAMGESWDRANVEAHGETFSYGNFRSQLSRCLDSVTRRAS